MTMERMKIEQSRRLRRESNNKVERGLILIKHQNFASLLNFFSSILTFDLKLSLFLFQNF